MYRNSFVLKNQTAFPKYRYKESTKLVIHVLYINFGTPNANSDSKSVGLTYVLLPKYNSKQIKLWKRTSMIDKSWINIALSHVARPICLKQDNTLYINF